MLSNLYRRISIWWGRYLNWDYKRRNRSRPTVEEVTGIFSDHWPDDMSPEEYIRKERDA